MTNELLAILPALATFCAQHNTAAWLVGGAARDLARGNIPYDLDIAVDADGVELARLLADSIGGAFVTLDDERGTGRVVCLPDTAHNPGGERLTIDMVQLRAPTLAEDLRLRDFTVNALALPLDMLGSRMTSASELALQPADFIDPCGGLADIASRSLRPCSPGSLHDDPLRALRALRLAAGQGFAIAPELDSALRDVAPLITQVASERVRDELLKLLGMSAAAPWLRYMDEVGLLTRLFPELEPTRTCEQPIVHFLPVLAHTLEAVACLEWLLEPLTEQQGAQSPAAPAAVQTYPDLPRTLPYSDQFRAHFAGEGWERGEGQSRTALLKLATLLHDNAKPQTKQAKEGGGVSFYGHQSQGAAVALAIARRLRLSRQRGGYVALVVREHMRPGQLRGSPHVTPRAVARFFRDMGNAGPDVLLHGMADHMATRGPHIDRDDWQHHIAWTGSMLAAYWGQPPERTRPLLNGNDLMTTLDIAPGKLVGDLLREVQEAQAAGEIATREEALDLARRMLRERQAQ